MNYLIRKNCLFCDKELNKEFFVNDLSNFVAHYQIEKNVDIGDNHKIPFNISICDFCKTPQLKYLGFLDEIYKINHADSTGKLMIELHKLVCQKIIKYKNNIQNIIEIGSSKGILADFILEKLQLQYNIIEPSYWGTRENKIIYDDFYENIDDSKINANTLIISHVFEHFYEPKKILEKIEKNKNIENFFLIFPDLEYYINNNVLHVLNTEHTFYCDNLFLVKLLDSYGFQLIEQENFQHHSVLFYFQRKEKGNNKEINFENTNYSLDVFMNTIYKTIDSFNKIINANKENKNKKRIYLWPASIHTLTLFNFGLQQNITGMLDNSPNKIGKKLYGTELEIFSFKEIIQEDNKDVIILLNGGIFNKDIEKSIQDCSNVVFYNF